MSWLKKIYADYEDYREQVESLSYTNPLPFKSWFPNGQNRVYLPFYTDPHNIDENVKEVLDSVNCSIIDYRKGYCQKGGVTLRISKAIEQAMQLEVQELNAKNQRGEVYDYGRDLAIIKNFYDEILEEFVNSPNRIDASQNQYYVVISQDPHDIAKMSTDQHWTSCMELGSGSHHRDVFCEVSNGGMVAYLVRQPSEQQFTNPFSSDIYRRYLADEEVSNAIARIHIRRFDNKQGESIAIPEGSVYGNDVAGFEGFVQNWIDNHQVDVTPGIYFRQGGEYSDTFGGSTFISPHEPEEVLKWLRGEGEDARYSTWTVYDSLYDELITWDDSDSPEEKTFNTRKEAEEYVNSKSYDDSWRDYEPEWLEFDEDSGEYVFQRYQIVENAHDDRKLMKNHAIFQILNADRGEYPAEIIEEIKNGIDFSSYNDGIPRLFARKYPDLMTDNDHYQMGDTNYLEYISNLPEGEKKDQLKAEELKIISSWLDDYSMASWAEKDPEFKKRINERNRAIDINEQISQGFGVASRWGILLNDNVLKPLQSLFKPIPENVTQKLVDLADNIPNMGMYSGQGPTGRVRDEGLNNVANIVHALHMTKTDTPTVQNFYASLLPKMGDGHRFRGDASPITLENLGGAIASLGENGRQFITPIKKVLRDRESWLRDLQKMRILPIEQYDPGYNSSYEVDNAIRLAKKDIERCLYIIEALEQGKPSGKYKYYSTKNWLQKLSNKMCPQQVSHLGGYNKYELVN